MCLFSFQTHFIVLIWTGLCAVPASRKMYLLWLCCSTELKVNVKYCDVSPGTEMYFICSAFLQPHKMLRLCSVQFVKVFVKVCVKKFPLS